MPRVVLPVKVAETGAVINVDISSPYDDGSVVELRHTLAIATGVAFEDQILLIGPPYKPLKRLDPPLSFSSSSRDDQTIRLRRASGSGSANFQSSSSLSQSGAVDPLPIRSIYLYSRRTLDTRSSNAPVDSELAISLPDLPTDPPEASSSFQQLSSSSSASCGPGSGGSGPLGQVLVDFERLARLNLAKGQMYAERGRRVLEACIRCLEEQRIQRDAGEVACSNLMDHLSFICRDHQSLLKRHTEQSRLHGALLERHSLVLNQLERHLLHPALKEALRESLSQDGASMARRECAAVTKAPSAEPITLLDCVPVERVRNWFGECKDVKQKLEDWLGMLGREVEKLRVGVEAEGQVPMTVDVAALAHELEGLKRQLTEQEKWLGILEKGYAELLERIRQCLRLDMHTGGEIVGAKGQIAKTCEWLDSKLHSQASIMATCEGIDHDMLSQARTLANCKTQMGRWLAGHLLTISRFQGDIQSLRSRIAIGDQALNEERRNFVHLKHIEQLPAAYEAMLIELTRRRAYARLFDIKVKHTVDHVASFREGEMAARAEFLKQHAIHLMPIFSQIFPTMQDRPPHFQAKQVVPEQRLPAVEDKICGEEGEEGDPGGLLMREYMSCLQIEQVDIDEAAQGSGTARSVNVTIMPGADATRSPAEVEAKCVEQELVIAQMRAKIQNLELLVQEERQLHQTAEQAPHKDEGSIRSPLRPHTRTVSTETSDYVSTAQVKHLQEDNDALRSTLNSMIWTMHELRQAAILTAATTDRSDLEARGVMLPGNISAANHQQIVDLMDGVTALVISQLKGMQSTLQDQGRSIKAMQSLQQDLKLKAHEMRGLRTELDRAVGKVHQKKISFCEFDVGDIALFMPTSHPGENRQYLAFHQNCPHRYLSNESLESIRAGSARSPDYFLGRIIYIDSLCADEINNPHRLHPGTVYYIIHASAEAL